MRLPGKQSNLGRVLRAMHGAGKMTSGGIRVKAGLHPDTAVTARIRDLRKMGCQVLSWSLPHPTDAHKRIWYYRLYQAPKWVDEELQREQQVSRGIAA